MSVWDGSGKDGGGGYDKDDNNEDENHGKGGFYQVMTSAGADGLVKLWTRRE